MSSTTAAGRTTARREADPKTLALAYLEAVAQKRFDQLDAFLHTDLEFSGPAMALHSARDYVSALQRLGPILLRNDVKKTFVDGSDVCVVYDFVTDTTVGAIPTVEWLTVDGDRIRTVRLLYDRVPWRTVMEEASRRASATGPGRQS